ncbi:hypothetical protein [Aquitalea pelogenes]|uniref:hypothetical protein n=1 Tax=Aquitalea pelogenes TaxID=1293573 RepID=UPI0035B143C1
MPKIKDTVKKVVEAISDHQQEQNLLTEGVAEIKETVKKTTTKKSSTKAAPKETIQEPIPLGEKEGVNVVKNEKDGRYEVTLPNFYDAYFDLAGKNKPGQIIGYSKSADTSQKVQNVTIAIPFDAVKDDKVAIEVNRKINHTRNTLKDIKEEIDTLDMTAHFAINDDMSAGKKLFSKGIPKTEVKGEDGKSQWKNGGFFKGEIVAVGKYFVVAKDTNPNIPDDQVVLRKLETNKILDFKKGDYEVPAQRYEIVKARLGLTDADFDKQGSSEVIKPGVVKYFAYDDSGRATKIASAYTKPQAQQNNQTQKTKTNDAALAQ